MKTVSKVGIVVWSIVALLLVGVMIAGICVGPEFITSRLVYFGGSALTDENTEILGEYSVDINDVEEINLDWKSGLIRINTYSGDDIKLTERVPQNSTNISKMTYEVESGELAIKCNIQKKWQFLGYGYEQKVIDIEIPEKKSELIESVIIMSKSADIYVNDLELENLNMDLTSGDVNVDKLKANSCYIKTTSGNVIINNMEAFKSKNNTINAECTSGNIKVYDCTAKDINLTTTSGNIDCNNVTASGSAQMACTSGNIKTSNINAEGLDLSATSGNITVDGEVYKVDIASSSGNIKVSSTVMPEKLGLTTGSGNIKLSIPEDEKNGFTATCDLGSGDFDSNLDVMLNQKNDKLTYGNGEYSYSFESGSGNLTINGNSDVD